MMDKSKLKELAMKAGAEEWDFDTAETPIRIVGGEVVGGDALPYGDVYTVKEWETPEGPEPLTIVQEVGVDYGRYIASANPAAILELLAENEQQRALIEEYKQAAFQMGQVCATRPSVDLSGLAALRKELNRISWDGADDGWNRAITAVQKRIADILATKAAQPEAHASDCAVHNEPAMPNGPCDCGAQPAAGQVEGPFGLALNVKHPDCHKAADAFWNYWNENGETHKRGYYESTWGAINRAIRTVGVVPWVASTVPPVPEAEKPDAFGASAGLTPEYKAAQQAKNEAASTGLARLARQAQAGEADERYEFERHMSQKGEAVNYLGDGLYGSGHVQDLWDTWMTRANLAAPVLGSAAQAAPVAQADPIGELQAAARQEKLEEAVRGWTAGAQEGEQSALTPLDYRAQGREEALAIILAEDPEDPFSECTRTGANGDAGDFSTYWNEDRLRELLHIGDRKHDAYDRAEAAYWDAQGRKDEAEREMRLVERAPFYKPLSDFLSKHEAWDLMASLKCVTAPSSTDASAQADDQQFDRQAERRISEAGLGGSAINPNAISMLDIFEDDASAQAAQADVRDAARYRFLRAGFGDFGPDVDLHNAFVDGNEKMDAVIDAAMAKRTPADEVKDAARDVLAERRRQVTEEGYDDEHDNGHVNDEIAALATFYAMPPAARDWNAESTGYGPTLGEAILPTDCAMPIPTGDRRRELVKACALLLAEIERLDRARTPADDSQPATPNCWNCKRPYTLEQRAEADGNCPHCGVEIELDDDGDDSQPAVGGAA